MENLLKETTETLNHYNKTLDDIEWFGNEEIELTGDLEKAIDFYYDDGYGGQEVLNDLILVGKDFWLERHEYNGAEWWEYKKIPLKPQKNVKLGLRNLKINENIDSISDDEYGDDYCLIKSKDLT